MKGTLKTYFNFTANAVMPVNGSGADHFLRENKEEILNTARTIKAKIKFTPRPLYRGILLKEDVNVINPHSNFTYLSFSESLEVAMHFGNPDGFGSEFMNNRENLGQYGYVIRYTPKPEDVLFHYSLFDIFPYADAFNYLGMDGQFEVESLKRQKEVIILQPEQPFTIIEKFKN